MTTGAIGEPLPADELLAFLPRVLSTTAPRLLALASTIPEDVLRRRPLVDEWSPYEVLQHLLDTERLVFPPRIRAFLAGSPVIGNVDQNAAQWETERTSSAIAEDIAALRAGTLELIETLVTDDLEREAVHSQYGRITLGQMLHYVPAHDLTHLVQIERALIQPFLPGVGPWAGNIEDMMMR